jgi:hypothetical protein
MKQILTYFFFKLHQHLERLYLDRLGQKQYRNIVTAQLNLNSTLTRVGSYKVIGWTTHPHVPAR